MCVCVVVHRPPQPSDITKRITTLQPRQGGGHAAPATDQAPAARGKQPQAGAKSTAGRAAKKHGGGATYQAKAKQALQPRFASVASRINLGPMSRAPAATSHAAVASSLKKIVQESGTRGSRHTGRDDRATSEQVLDPRTRMILFKLLNSDFISAIHGCVSTGKEVRAVRHSVVTAHLTQRVSSSGKRVPCCTPGW